MTSLSCLCRGFSSFILSFRTFSITCYFVFLSFGIVQEFFTTMVNGSFHSQISCTQLSRLVETKEGPKSVLN